MDKIIYEALRAWATAYDAASTNSSLILRESSDEVLQLCAERMQELQRREQVLLDLEGQKGLPKPLVSFLSAKNDIACASCMYSSAGPVHTECQRRIDVYFRAVDNLYVYASGLV